MSYTPFLLQHLKLFPAVLLLLLGLPRASAAQLLASASDVAAGRTSGQTVLGDVRPFGDGTARTWVQLDGDGNPVSLGITLTEDALNGLPNDVTPGLIWMVEYVLALPSGIPDMPFDHVGVNWNPRGHVPDGIYNVPHFDFHFYTISPEARSRITARGADLEMCRKPPSAGHLPEGYMFAPESEEPGMGGHWVDPLSHEFHGGGFTQSFIYGTHDGAVIFYEPMITKALLETRPDVSHPLKIAGAFAHRGYYPTSYGIRFDPEREEYSVTLEGLTLREAAN
jgi:hypothetical protein